MPKLREIRIAKGRQQKELAQKIGTDEPMMSKFENYKCLPVPPMMDKLLEELGCTIDDIYAPHEVFFQSGKPISKSKKKKATVYNLSVRLPREAKAFLKKALTRCGFKDITAWIGWCYARLETQYDCLMEAEKKDSTQACKQNSEV